MPPSYGSNNSYSIANNLARSAERLATSYQRLSSGMRINSAGDDAAGLALSMSLSSDAKVYGRALANVNDAISLSNVADSALSELSSTLSRIKELATSASNSTLSRDQRVALNTEAQALREEYNRIVSVTSYNDQSLFAGTTDSISIQAGDSAASAINISIGSELDRTTGNGTFATGTILSYSYNTELVAGDIDGDGDQDFVVGDPDESDFTLHLNNGCGTFSTSTLGVPLYDQTLADVDGDGDLDLLGSNGYSGVDVYLFNGTTFSGTPITSAITTISSGLEHSTGDIDGDGDIDLVFHDGAVRVSRNNGNGTFATPVSYSVAGTSYATVLKDLNNDGRPDIVTGSTSGVTIRLNNGNGTFGTAVSYVAGTNPLDIKVDDLNADGYQDIVTSGSDNTLNILLGNSSGTFSPRVSFAVTYGTNGGDIAIGDVTGEGYKDILVSRNITPVGILSGNGNGTFSAVASLTNVTSSFDRLYLDDFTGDGVNDVLAFHSNTFLYSGYSQQIYSLPSFSLASSEDALTTIDTIDSALTRVIREHGKVGAALGRLGSAANVIAATRENFQDAYSRIMTPDVADEVAKIVREQVLQDAGTAALAQSNLEAKSVLKLLVEP